MNKTQGSYISLQKDKFNQTKLFNSIHIKINMMRKLCIKCDTFMVSYKINYMQTLHVIKILKVIVWCDFFLELMLLGVLTWEVFIWKTCQCNTTIQLTEKTTKMTMKGIRHLWIITGHQTLSWKFNLLQRC